MRQSRQLPKDDYRIALNGGRRNLVLSEALPTEGTEWDVYQTAYRDECRTTILEAYKPAWRMRKEHEYSYRQADQAMHEGLESASALAYICGMNDHFMRSLQDRYDVIDH